MYEHQKFSVLRAVETGRPVVRSANTGISCIIDPRGNIISETDPMVQDILYGKAYSCSGTTLYTVIGDIWLYGCIVFIAVFCGYAIYEKKRKQVETDEN